MNTKPKTEVAFLPLVDRPPGHADTIRSAGCHNYAHYAAFYIHHMKVLDPVLMKKLQYGAFVRHITGSYNSTWKDMFIETTYMRLGMDRPELQWWPHTTIRW